MLMTEEMKIEIENLKMLLENPYTTAKNKIESALDCINKMLKE